VNRMQVLTASRLLGAHALNSCREKRFQRISFSKRRRDSQHNDILHNDTQQNDTQNRNINATPSITTESIKTSSVVPSVVYAVQCIYIVLLSVIMLKVFMASVVAPSSHFWSRSRTTFFSSSLFLRTNKLQCLALSYLRCLASFGLAIKH
jgi:hypothetical protein